MLLPVGRIVKYGFVVAYAVCNLAVVSPAAAQFHLPIPGIGGAGGKKGKNQPPPSPPPDSTQPPDSGQPPYGAPPDNSGGRGKKGAEAPGPKPAGVPIPLDSPIMQAFEKLQQQKVFHQRMAITANDPKMQQMMAQMGFMPAEILTVGDMKQVSMRFKFPVDGKSTDFELRSVSGNGRGATKWFSPAKDEILAKQDASIAKQLAESEAQAASSIAKDLAMGPAGIASAAMQGASAGANAAEAAAVKKQAHDFWEWQCRNGGAQASPEATHTPPPMTDLRAIGDDNIDGVAVTGYEFYVQQNGRFQGPMQMYIAKDTGLPARLGMNDPRMQGSMEMDYFGYNDSANFEVPDCLAKN